MRLALTAHRLVANVGLALGAVALATGMPFEIPPSIHVERFGTVWLGAPVVAFLLPLATIVTDALLRTLGLGHPAVGGGAAVALPVYEAIMLRVTACVVGVHAMVLAALAGLLEGRAWAAPIVPLMLGITLVGVGNLCPRLKRNLAIGIRTQRTLADHQVWSRVHRHVGYIVMVCGVLTITAAITVTAPVGPRMILIAGPLALVAGGLLVRRAENAETRRS